MYSSEVLINKLALEHNLRAFRRVIGNSQIMAVVKSNAYGHGLIPTAHIVESLTDWFATVNLDEALIIRKSGIKKPILVLSYFDLDQVSDAVKYNISLVVYDLKQAKAIDKAAAKLKKKAKIHLKVDVGTSRLGVTRDQVVDLALQIGKLKNLVVEGIFSHLAASEEDVEFTREQLAAFEAVLFELYQVGIEPKITHIACSAASLVFKMSHRSAIRLGIGLYGLWPSDEARKQTLKIYPKLELKPVLTWKTKIIQIKNLKAATFVGYGKSYKTHRATILAVLPVGYYEGFDRGLSNIGHVLVGEHRCRVIGRVCMNLTMIDVTDVKNVRVGDEAVLIGKQGKEEIAADEIAKQLDTINYEVIARINSLIPRGIVI